MLLSTQQLASDIDMKWDKHPDMTWGGGGQRSFSPTNDVIKFLNEIREILGFLDAGGWQLYGDILHFSLSLNPHSK